MIAIQTILLRWSKETRGEPYASPRSRHPKAYALPIPSGISRTYSRSSAEASENEAILLHRLAFWQTKEGFALQQDESLRLPLPEPGQPVDERLMAGLRLERREGRLYVELRYVPEFGKPVRTDGSRNRLRQTAFELENGEYGRLTVNGRHAWEEGHVYELRHIHIAFADEIPADFFIRNEPNRCREWLESLW